MVWCASNPIAHRRVYYDFDRFVMPFPCSQLEDVSRKTLSVSLFNIGGCLERSTQCYDSVRNVMTL
eukprot:14914658-Heterocapsa_arctica.AAC.1